MAGSPQEDEGSRAKGSPDKSDKLPRAHKRCINKDCREVLTLATKVRAAARPPMPPTPPRLQRLSLLDCCAAPAPAAAVLQEVQHAAV